MCQSEAFQRPRAGYTSLKARLALVLLGGTVMLSGAAAAFDFTRDLAGTTRPSTPTMGAFEPSGGGGAPQAPGAVQSLTLTVS